MIKFLENLCIHNISTLAVIDEGIERSSEKKYKFSTVLTCAR